MCVYTAGEGREDALATGGLDILLVPGLGFTKVGEFTLSLCLSLCVSLSFTNALPLSLCPPPPTLSHTHTLQDGHRLGRGKVSL